MMLTITAAGRAASLVPLTSFGAGDGWRAPFEVLPGDAAGTDSISPGLYNYLGNAVTDLSVNAGNLERGLAYNPTTGNLILVSRNNVGNTLPSIRILDGETGVDVGPLNLGSGVIAGGTFLYNMVGVAEDGAIYAANLTTNTAGAGGPFKFYRWADESSSPTLAFSGDPLNGTRLGDTFDVIGSGANTRMVAGYSSSGPPPTLSNSFALFTTTDGLNFTGNDVTLSATPPATLPANGEFRLGITFFDSDTVAGKSAANPVNVVNVTGTTGDVVANVATEGVTLRPMDFAVVGGKPLLAIVEASPDQTEAARARLFVYDMTDPSLPLAERKVGEASALPFTPGGPNQFVNLNGTGQVKFGAIEGNTAIIYAMSTNNGIQAFELTLDAVVENNGDYNGNGTVDAADYVLWRSMEGQSVEPSTGADGDGDGVIGPGDYTHWAARFGIVIGGGASAQSAVPEASTLCLALAAMGAHFAARRKRQPG
jgi:hypothetical protein